VAGERDLVGVAVADLYSAALVDRAKKDHLTSERERLEQEPQGEPPNIAAADQPKFAGDPP
jgi:hypothetical protein